MLIAYGSLMSSCSVGITYGSLMSRDVVKNEINYMNLSISCYHYQLALVSQLHASLVNS